jgi:hypothetical protein
MSGKTPTQPIVVTFRQIEKVITKQEAVQQIHEAAQSDPHASPEERAAVAAAIGNVLHMVRRAEADAGGGALVLTTPHHGPSSRLQSLIASGEAANLTFDPLPAGGEEAKFDTHDWFGWARVAWEKLKHLKPHAMIRPGGFTPEAFPETGRIAVLGDWGTGLYGAPHIAKSVKTDHDPFALLLHLGDVYYSGTISEVQQRFLEMWPFRNDAINRALNSNHEMYSGGEAYFKQTLPRFNQQGSYFACQNKHWTLVGLDVAYEDHAIDDTQVAWLEKILTQAGDRKVVLFSHHQLYSHFEAQGTKLWGHPRFGAILRSRRIFAWYWGHEHRCTIFEDRDLTFGLYARCIGHSGMPQSRKATRDLPRAAEPRYAKSEWRRSPAQTNAGNLLPSCVVLEGPNDFIPGEEDKFSPHGYAVLTFDGPRLIEQVVDPRGAVIYESVLAE